MIQFNLLPDVKLEYLKAERTRKLVITISVLAAVISITVLALLLSVTVLQKKHLNDLSRDIKSEESKIEGQSDLNKILTVQNQLNSLTDLHNTKPAASRLATFLTQITPAKAAINNFNIDFSAHTMTISGTADALATVNQYVDTLKFTTYTAGSSSTANPFSNVVLTSFGLTQHEADYTITLSYDAKIFDITHNVTLTVPNKVTTRSEIEQPTDLFKLPVDKPSGSTR